jgi:hypothetical protein
MSDGTILKAEKDFTPEVDKAIPEAEKLAEVYSQLHEGLCTRLLTISACRMAKHSKQSNAFSRLKSRLVKPPTYLRLQDCSLRS